jgi:hypothetical protein
MFQAEVSLAAAGGQTDLKGLPRCPGDVGRHDVSRVPVQAGPGAVIAHRGARIGVRGGLLHVPQRHPGIERGGDKRVPERMGADVLGDPGAPGDAADDPGGAVPVQPPPVPGDEQRSFGALADSQVDRAGGARGERDGHHLAALTGDHHGPVAALEPEMLDVRAGRLRHPQPVEREQRDQGVLGGRPEPGGDQQGAELVAVQGGGVRLVVQPGAADVRGRGVVEEFLFDGVLVEPGDRAQPPGDRGAGAAFGFQFAGAGRGCRPRGSGRGTRPGIRRARAARRR